MKCKTYFIILTLITIGLYINLHGKEGGTSRLFLLKPEYLDLSKKLWQQEDPLISRNMKILLGNARAALKRGPYSVTAKKHLPPSGDKHDFLAYMAYSWPNPDTPDGTPWIVKDGYLNPEASIDWEQLKPMGDDLEMLGLAYYFTGDEAFAEHAALLLRTWFIDKETRMNPRAPYSKLAPGLYDEGGFAVAGFGSRFRDIYDTAGILERSPHWTEEDHSAFRQWTREFMQWAETSEYGITEWKRPNNHGTFYDMTMALQALYIEDLPKARAAINNYIKNRFKEQFKADGTQPWEMRRANNYDYHRVNLMIAFDIAQLADHFGDIDLWNFKSAAGASLRKSVDFLIPFFTGKKQWPYFQAEPFAVPDVAKWRLLRRAALGFKEYEYEKAAETIPGDSDLYTIELGYPRAAIPGVPAESSEQIVDVSSLNPRLFLLDKDYLDLSKELWKSGNKLITSSMNLLLGEAGLVLKRGPYSVTEKDFTPPSGDKHDFFAYMAYSWANPDSKDGLPWIVRDGYNNPEARMDWNRMEPMGHDVYILALAYYFTGKPVYAEHAALLLRTWFIDKETRMNPNADYGKSIPGQTKGGYSVAGFGYVFRRIYDAAGILETSSYWTTADREGLKEWTRQFMQWAETTKYGKIEFRRDNNHGTFYDMNMALQALYVGDENKARETIKRYMENRMPNQFNPDGTQPWEMRRANNYDYHRVNLMIALDIAQLADRFNDIDVRNYRTAEGAGLKKAVEFLVPFFIGEKPWPYFRKEKFEIPAYDRWCLLQRAALGYKSDALDIAAMKIPEFHGPSVNHLVYPRLAITLKRNDK